MRKLLIYIVIMSFAFIVREVFAQTSATSPSHEASTPQAGYRQFYNPDKLEKVKGTITEVSQTIDFIEDARECVHLTIKIDGLNTHIPVHVGPAWYMEHQGVRLKKGDKVEITGSRITYDNQAIILAAEIRRGDRTFVLREENGRPAWAGCSTEVISQYSTSNAEENHNSVPVATRLQDEEN